MVCVNKYLDMVQKTTDVITTSHTLLITFPLATDHTHLLTTLTAGLLSSSSEQVLKGHPCQP